MSPIENIENALLIWNERNKMYGDAYKKGGEIMKAFFPDGIALDTVDDFARFQAFAFCVAKLNRYSVNLADGGHKDSADDLINYAAILSSFTAEG